MYINIPGGFELVPLNRQRLDRLREATKKLEEMLADNEITAPADDMIVTLYIPRGAMPGPIIARIAARDIPGANQKRTVQPPRAAGRDAGSALQNRERGPPPVR